MKIQTSFATKLYGTDESVSPISTLTAGPMSCDFDQGALRSIKICGTEAIRNIAIVVRDKDWGTYPPVLSNVELKQKKDSFSISFDAACQDDKQEIRYHANISGSADGKLNFTCSFQALTDFLTNRTGFVVLHPLTGVAGYPVSIESVTGDITQSSFPELIDPVQPFKNIRAITHAVLPGVNVRCQMTGDTFEMEDHRQWNDASFKTYVRPLALPWPYTIAKADCFTQSVELFFDVKNIQAPAVHKKQDTNACTITLSKADTPKPMPATGLGLEPQHLAGAQHSETLLRQLKPQQLVVWHELDKHSIDDLTKAAELCSSINTKIELQAVIPDKDFKIEIAELAKRCRQANMILGAIHVAPSKYLKSIMPGPAWPAVTELAMLYDEVRLQFPGIPVGGGMLSFFPELNRHRPPIESMDFVSHASNIITHASDDISVTENLEALPYIIKTCRAFAPNKPYHVGPSSIAMRFNPYGSKTMDNPNNSRVAMARMDPRQRGLLNSAWTGGYAAHMVRGGIDCINLHAPTGEYGVFNYHEKWPRPGFDDTEKQVFPVYHVLRGLTRAASLPQLQTNSSNSREVEAFSYEDDGKQIVWVSNLTNKPQLVSFDGLRLTQCDIATLSTDTFEQCTDSIDGFDLTTSKQIGSELTLSEYGVVRITC